MGNINNFFKHLISKKEVRLLMIGLDGTGKTTILYQLKLGELIAAVPTIGFNVESVTYKNIEFIVWDIGGEEKLRPLWRYYFLNTQGLIYAVDSSDRDRIEEARKELHRILAEDELKDASLLVFANKQDLSTSMKAAEIADLLDLNSIRHRNWKVQESSGITGQGLLEGLEWLSRQLVTHR